jgi:hypothetical protein
MGAYHILSDAPSEKDFLRFDRYLTPLLDAIADPETETPLTVGIFGPWGSGKSTVLGLLRARLEARSEEFLVVEFNPWIYRSEPNLLTPLLHTLRDALDDGAGDRFKKSAKKIADCLLRLGADLFLKTVTVGNVAVKDLEEYEKKYVESQRLATSELRRLRGTLRSVAADLGGRRLVLLVDDLDRCEPLEIVDLVEATKLFLDVPNVIVVLAVDKMIVDTGIEARYHEFGFPLERVVNLGASYLEKVVQLPIYLHPLGPEQIKQFVERHPLAPDVRGVVGTLATYLAPNPRKIKRIINLLSTSFAVLGDLPLDRGTLARLIVLQVQEPAIYEAVARDCDFLLALESVYERPAFPAADFFNPYGSRKKVVAEFCEKHFRPDSYLPRLFKDAPFKATGAALGRYFSLIGD